MAENVNEFLLYAAENDSLEGVGAALEAGACGHSETAAPQGGVFSEENHGGNGSPSSSCVQWLGIDDKKRGSAGEGYELVPEARKSAKASIKLVQLAKMSKLLRCCNPKCGKPGYRSALKLCGRCKLTRYCSRDCQIQHWSVGHKKCCGQDNTSCVRQTSVVSDSHGCSSGSACTGHTASGFQLTCRRRLGVAGITIIVDPQKQIQDDWLRRYEERQRRLRLREEHAMAKLEKEEAVITDESWQKKSVL
uniref:MYND-type domain-containing protein n=1 Tax=Branchiostoma floridae TaxID=7739 RepID=C3ZXY4_BRAFL|eukprot:XP_002586592.1 hypothetical protein BRAFLDRAFT_106186 [Branchiostoma floridae]